MTPYRVNGTLYKTNPTLDPKGFTGGLYEVWRSQGVMNLDIATSMGKVAVAMDHYSRHCLAIIEQQDEGLRGNPIIDPRSAEIPKAITISHETKRIQIPTPADVLGLPDALALLYN